MLDPFRHVGPYGEPRRTPSRLLPIGNKREFAARVLGSLAILAGLLLAVGALGR